MRVAADVDEPSDRILAWKVAARERLVHEQHPRTAGIIPVIEAATGDDADAHDVEIVRTDQPRVGRSFWIVGRQRIGEVRRPSEPGVLRNRDERQLARICSSSYARCRPQPRHESRRKRPELHARVAIRRQADLKCQNVRWVVTETDCREIREAANQQAPADKERCGHRNLSDDQHGARAVPIRPRSQRGSMIEARVPQRRREPAERGCGERSGYREGQRRGIDGNFFESREWKLNTQVQSRNRRRQRAQQADPAERQQDAGDCAHRGEEERLGQQLTDDAAARRTQRDANGNLPFSRRRAREQQVGHVDARDEEHETDGRHQHEQRRPDGCDDEILESNELVSGARRRNGLLAVQLANDCADFRGGRIGRDTVGKTHDQVTSGRRSAVRHSQAERDPELVLPAETEVLRHHTDDRVAGRTVADGRTRGTGRNSREHIVQRNGTAERGRIAGEVSAPRCVTEDDYRLRPQRFVRGREDAAQGRPHAQHLQERRRDARAFEPRRLDSGPGAPAPRIAARHDHERQARSAGVSDGVGPVPQIDEVSDAQPDPEPARHAGRRLRGRLIVEEARKAIRIRIRQRPQEHRVHDAEDGGVCPGAKGEREDGDGREAGAAAERPDGVAEIAPQVFEPDEGSRAASRTKSHFLWDSSPPARHGKRRSSSARARAPDSP